MIGEGVCGKRRDKKSNMRLTDERVNSTCILSHSETRDEVGDEICTIRPWGG